jgi:CelD/BcsL family acetyltransferase involved in cellulose biosynthesis
MRYYCVPAGQLSPEQREAWIDIQEGDPQLDSPYFRPEFTCAVADVLPGCEVAVMDGDGRPFGFLPYHRSRGNVAQPVAPEMTDFQGAIVAPGTEWDPAQLLRDCELFALYFDHVIAGQQAFQPYRWSEATSPYLDVSGGFEAYLRNRVRAGSESMKKIIRSSRKMERELGPLRLEFLGSDREVFRLLVEWKTRQYYRTKVQNPLASQWRVDLLDRLLSLQTDGLSGVMATLYAGDRVASVLLGMLSRGVFHGWFAVYDVALHQYSPGLILFVKLAQIAVPAGIRRIDLGRGRERFKSTLMTGVSDVAVIGLDLRPVVRPLRRLGFQVESYVRRSALERPVRSLVRNLRAVSRFRSWRRSVKHVLEPKDVPAEPFARGTGLPVRSSKVSDAF